MFITVTRQLKRAMSAVKLVLAIAGTAAAALDAKLQSHLGEGERFDGVEGFMLALVRWIQSDHDRLEEREARQRRALRKLDQLRLRRNEKREDLYGLLQRIRQSFEDTFGQGTAVIYLGLGPKLSKLEPMALRRLARDTVNILTDPELVTPEPKVQGLWGNPVEYSAQIEDLLVPFKQAIEAVESQKREVEKTQKAKADLLDELRARLTWSIRLFEAIYQLAGLDFHADRLRLKVSARPKADEQASDGEQADADGEQPAASSEAPDSTSGD